jgi:hypothetical protein
VPQYNAAAQRIVFHNGYMVFIVPTVCENAVIFGRYIMSTATWEPSPADFTLSEVHINELLACLTTDSPLHELLSKFNWLPASAKAPLLQWQTIAENYNETQLVELIKFYTRAEEELGWNLKDKSAVISLFKTLKKRVGTDKELVKWVKAHSSNRFLPFGAVL